jgi:hypothetical protein
VKLLEGSGIPLGDCWAKLLLEDGLCEKAWLTAPQLLRGAVEGRATGAKRSRRGPEISGTPFEVPIPSTQHSQWNGMPIRKSWAAELISLQEVRTSDDGIHFLDNYQPPTVRGCPNRYFGKFS